MAFDKNNTSLFMKVVIVIFAVILVATLCLPFFSGCTSAGSQATDEATEDSTADQSGSSASTDASGKYSAVIDSLLKKHEADPGNLTYVANLGNRYKEMALSIQNAAGDETDDDATEAFKTAISYYDEYLGAAANDSSILQSSVNAVTLSRAVCLFYTQDKEQTVADLASYLEENPDYAMGWYYLGSFYQELGDADKAKEAYTNASEKDPDNEAGVGLYAQYALLVIQSQEEAAAQEESADESSADDGSDAAAEPAEASTDGGSATESAGESSKSADAAAESTGAADASAPTDASASTSGPTSASTPTSASSTSSADSGASEK